MQNRAAGRKMLQSPATGLKNVTAPSPHCPTWDVGLQGSCHCTELTQPWAVLLLSTSNSQETQGKGKLGEKDGWPVLGTAQRESRAASTPWSMHPKGKGLANRLLHHSVPQSPTTTSRAQQQRGCKSQLPACNSSTGRAPMSSSSSLGWQAG